MGERVRVQAQDARPRRRVDIGTAEPLPAAKNDEKAQWGLPREKRRSPCLCRNTGGKASEVIYLSVKET